MANTKATQRAKNIEAVSDNHHLSSKTR